MNEVKEVKGVMILNSDGSFWSNKIFCTIKAAKSEILDCYAYSTADDLFSLVKSVKFVTVVAKIEITGAA